MKHIFDKCSNTKYAKGGGIDAEKQNEEMIENLNKSIKHHSAELGTLIKKNPKIATWVVAKLERASTDMSDITHFLDGKKPIEFAKGGGVDAEKQNEEMAESLNKSIKHHSAELDTLIKKNHKIASWVVAKLERVSTDMSDITHYLDGRKASEFSKGGGVGLEQGAASILIKLGKSTITVYHGEDNDELLQIKNAPAGSWAKIWETLKSIKPAKMADGGWVKKAGISIGDILKYKKSDSYVCVNKVEENGFGAFFCDKDGIATIREGSSWTMWFWEYELKKWKKVGHRKLEHVSKEKDGKTYSFYKSGNEKVDTYCSLLDDRYQFFSAHAPKNLQTKFDSLENDNYHFTCAQLVDDFFNNPTWKHLKNHRLVLEDGGYLAKPQEIGKMAKGGAIANAKENWTSYTKESKKEDLIEAGYSASVAKDLSSESWDSLEKSVQNAYKDVMLRDSIKHMKDMMRSIYAYDFEVKEDNKYLDSYKEKLGSKLFDKVFKEQKKELEKYEVEPGVYTDSEGGTYNSLKLKK